MVASAETPGTAFEWDVAVEVMTGVFFAAAPPGAGPEATAVPLGRAGAKVTAVGSATFENSSVLLPDFDALAPVVTGAEYGWSGVKGLNSTDDASVDFVGRLTATDAAGLATVVRLDSSGAVFGTALNISNSSAMTFEEAQNDRHRTSDPKV
ncbi:hypothetical protein RS3R6_02930 [Pseudomonas atacamensis]|uniref:Phage tail protein n=1 Tax=Pseudomonas atacamensis TaxID=2565368 RepID=A0ABQ5PD19_9PSED|nr:hypothetical protein RS3R1_04800 [Pseudomonas atacamensis]GLH52112.1 hypothetical protein RS3R6_02930 [Pseudomonas atacamensis]